MKKGYNPTWARNQALRAAARSWHHRGLLSRPQLQAIGEAYPLDFYRPTIYLRILLFLLSVLGYSAAVGMLFLIGNFFWEQRDGYTGITDGFSAALMLLAAIGGQLLLGSIIRSSRTYRAGSDLALLYMSLGFAATAVSLFIDATLPTIFVWFSLTSLTFTLWLVPVLALLIWATARFGDDLLAAAAYALLLALLTTVLLQFGAGRLLLPFAVMGLAVGLYQLIRYLTAHTDYWYYRSCFITLETLALITFYLGGNYFIVREGNAVINGLPVSGPIPFAPVFYLLTALVPLFYLYRGLRQHRRIWLLTGLITLAFSGFTLRFYHAVLPPAVASTLLGALLIGLMAAALRYLRTPRHGLSADPTNAPAERPGLNLESIIVAQTAHAPQVPAPGLRFGGGQSGGGGAEEQW